MKNVSLVPLSLMMLIAATALSAKVPPDCEKWFNESGAKPGTGRDCVWKCVAHPIDMGTFTCGGYCDELCGREVVPKDDRYLKGTKYAACRDEYLAAIRHFSSVATVQKARDRAFALTQEHFKQNRADDESDAFRHFVWSSLIAMESESNVAAQFLEAHESCVTEDAAQEMDRHNNQTGIQTVEKLRKEGRLTEEAIVKEGLDLVKNGKLVVIAPRRKPK